MSRIWAVARHMIAEAIRLKVAIVFISLLVIILPLLPFVLAGDGVTLTSRVQSFLVYALGGVGFLLSVLTIFLACGTLFNEMRERHIFMIASKPIPRWQFFAGKWLGIATLNAGLLLFSGLLIWGFTIFYLKNLPTFADDRATLENEVLTVRHAIAMEEPDFTAQVDERLRKLREEGRLDTVGAGAQQDMRANITREIRNEFRSLKPGEFKDYVFRGLIVDRDQAGFVHLHFKPKTPTGVDELVMPARWQCGDPNDVNTLTPVRDGRYVVERYQSEPVPTSAVTADGTLHLRIQNISDRDSFTFESKEDMEVLYGIGTFHWNVFRALCIIWCRLAFLAVLGLLLSTFVSMPVACMGAFLVFAVAASSGFLNEALGMLEIKPSGEDPMWIFGPLVRGVVTGFIWLIPDFSKVDPVGTVAAGRVVTLTWVIHAVVVLVFVQSLVLGLIGCLIFSRKELAQVVV